ncbi:MAG TPA: GNAT family N-acetyltransferase [Solirubrobacterales bacterium]|nr:GNAT family N-acetyltransferase [Solirubrobacterales bacterium]
MPRFLDPEPLGNEHRINGFDCGVGSLDVWLVKHARAAAGAGSARTYVVIDEEQDRVVGYHALSVASIKHAETIERARKGMPKHPIPAMLLARLAVDKTVQGRGIGAFLLRDAMSRAVSVAEQAGIRLMLIHTLSEDARRFYEHFGFERSPSDQMNLQLLIKDIRHVLERASA